MDDKTKRDILFFDLVIYRREARHHSLALGTWHTCIDTHRYPGCDFKVANERNSEIQPGHDSHSVVNSQYSRITREINDAGHLPLRWQLGLILEELSRPAEPV